MKKFALLSLITSFFLGSLLFADTTTQKPRILVGSPIRQRPAILELFLKSLKQLDQKSFTLDYFFVDDNDPEESQKLLRTFAKEHTPHCTLFYYEDSGEKEAFICNERTHLWNENLVWRVASHKDRMIAHAKKEGYDYLFLVDSDLLLHPKTISQLISAQKDIVSNVFWTKWNPSDPPSPQVWLLDQYPLFNHEIGEAIPYEEKVKRQQAYCAFLEKLQEQGTYEVGGLCGCTLISKAALQAGVKFKRIPNITFWGEDRHFCVRALSLGLTLHVDTHYPAYHIYRESDLAGVEDFYANINQKR